MKIIITTIILTLFSSLSFADGHTSGKFNASGMGAWKVNVMNAGKGDMVVTYDGIAGLADESHFSGEEQVEGTLKKYYANQKDLVLLKVETLKLDHLIWEQASDGNMFPHLYSPLNLSNVTDEFEIILQEDGSHKLPDNY